MKDWSMWIWWYGMFLALPLIAAGLFVKDRMARAIPQRVQFHGRSSS